MSAAHGEAIARRYVEAIAKRDLAAIEALYARHARVEDPVGSAPVVGIDAILEFYRKLAFPRILRAELTGPVCCPRNAVAFPFRVTSPAETGGGAAGTTDIIDVFELDAEGRVISMKAYWTAF